MAWTNPGPHLGFLPDIITTRDPRSAKEQIEDRYRHGGGYNRSPGAWEMAYRNGEAVLRYPGDPLFNEVSRIELPTSKETVILFDYAFVAIVQLDLSFEVVRMD